MSEILITIGITCYREGDLLRECWESVLAQTDDRWVVVLVMDGGADDKTREVFASIEHPKVVKKFAFDENVGPYPVRNKAFELTETPYHFYLDGDDMLPPGCIAAMYQTLQAHPHAAHIYGDYILIPSGGNLSKPVTISAPEDLLRISAGHGLYDVAIWKKLGGYSDQFARGGADLDLKISMYEAGYSICHCGEMFYRIRLDRPGSVSIGRSRTYADVALATVEKHPLFFRDETVKKTFLKGFFYRSIWAHASGGDRIGGTKYLLRAFRHLGLTNAELWFWAFYLVLGRNVVEFLKLVRDKVKRTSRVSDRV